MSETTDRRGGLRINWTINIGTLFTAGAFLVSAIIYIDAGSFKADQAQKDLTALQRLVSDQISDLHEAVKTGLADVRTQIQTLPDQRARLDQDDRQLTDIYTRLTVIDTRLRAVEQQAAELQVQVGAIGQASKVRGR